MRTIGISFIRRAFHDQSGQVMVWAVGGFMALLGVGALTIDVGHAYAVHSQLQSAVNAAALAAAGDVYYSSSETVNSTSVANQYSATKGDSNVNPLVGTALPVVTTTCLDALMLPKGTLCIRSGTNKTAPNAVKVTQTANVPTWFMRIFGFPTIPVSAMATATMQGSAEPWNVAIIIDSTGSMNTADSQCIGGVTEFQCALDGVQTWLEATHPCPGGEASCTVDKANIRVALFTFPNVSTATVHDDIDCSGNPTALPYTLPMPGLSSYAPMTYTQTNSPKTPWTATYEVTYPVTGTGVTNAATDADANGFVSDYYDPTSSDTLNHSSSLVKATGFNGATGTKGCLTYTQGIVNSGMGNTYYAGSIYAAQAALIAEQKLYGGKNALIFLSDGQANLVANQFPNNSSANTSVGCNGGTYSGSQYSLKTCGTSTAAQTGAVYLTPATVSSSLGYSTVNSTGAYPSTLDQCQQAIVAAQYAATLSSNPTTVFSVAYGSEDSGCYNSTDSTKVAKGTYNVGISSPPGSSFIPCVTMEDIASSLLNFYSDYNQSGGSVDTNCVDPAHTVVNLNDIFLAISTSFTSPRLVSNDAQ
jgi:Flp pilus assembly protein TadG